MIRKTVPALPMASGDAFKSPFGYGKVGKCLGVYEYYLIPFNYLVRLIRWLKGAFRWLKELLDG